MNWEQINNLRGLSKEKYSFYLGTYKFEDFGKGKIAKELPLSRVGWGSRAVEMRGNKTVFDCFENDELEFTAIMEKYHIYEALEKIKEDVLVAGCGFMGLVGDRVLPFTAEEAAGVFDWQELNLSYGAAVFSDKTARGYATDVAPDEYVVYKKDKTIIQKTGEERKELENSTGRPLMGVLTYRANTKRPFGKSVLNAASRAAIIDASRTTRQAMISAYHYNNKVDVLLGVDNDTELDRVESQTGDTLTVSPNENGQIPQIGEFGQHAMTPFTDTILIAARNFCTATKLTLANLGISSDAPQSPEALEIVSDDLRDDISQWHRELGEELKYLCMTLFMYEQGISEIDDNLRTKYEATIPTFRPTYRVDVGKFGDGLFKIAEKAPGVLYSRSLWRQLGLTSSEIDETIASIQESQL